MTGYLKSENYNTELVDRQFEKPLNIKGSELLRKKLSLTDRFSRCKLPVKLGPQSLVN